MARTSLKSVLRLIDSVANELPPEKAFLNDLEKSIELEARDGNRKPSQTYKPSSMNCMRSSYYQIMGVEPEEDDASYTSVGIRNSGSDIHVRIQSAVTAMQKFGFNCEYIDVADFVTSRNLTDIQVVAKSGMETKLYNKRYNISFLCDGIIRYKGRYYILEVKTETSFKFMKRTGVDPSHYNQAATYSLSLGLSDVIFVYINRDILDMKSYLFNVTDKMKQDIVGYITTCDQYVVDNTVPPKPVEASKKFCQYCGYRQRCELE